MEILKRESSYESNFSENPPTENPMVPAQLVLIDFPYQGRRKTLLSRLLKTKRDNGKVRDHGREQAAFGFKNVYVGR